MTVWRVKLNSQREDLHDQPGAWDAARAYCRDASVVGVGWGRPDVLREGAPLDEVLAAVAEVERWTPAGPRAISRLANDVVDGDLVWTRDRAGGYWLGQIRGPWRYDASEDARRWDLNNVRACAWLDEPMRDFQVPGAVVRNFAGPGETLRRIPSPAATRMTEMIFTQATDPRAVPEAIAPAEVLAELLDPTDVEDVVLLSLQADGWVLLPSSRMHDTQLYEAALRRRDGRVAIVSVKSGPNNQVPVRALAENAGGAQVFVYSTHGAYDVDPASVGATEVAPSTLVAFMVDSPELLPPRIEAWLERTS